MKTILVVTYGRSGSTLLQGLLNVVPGVVVRGENEYFVQPLREAYSALVKAHAGHGNPHSPTDPWFGSGELAPATFLQDMRHAIHRQLLGGRDERAVKALGFKEIRYFSWAPENLPDHLDFLQRLFPDHLFIFHFRDHAQVTRSGWWVDWDSVELTQRLEAFEESARAYAEKLAPDTYVMSSYQALLDDPQSILQPVCEYVGVPMVRPDIVQWVLGRDHSYGSRRSAKQSGKAEQPGKAESSAANNAESSAGQPSDAESAAPSNGTDGVNQSAGEQPAKPKRPGGQPVPKTTVKAVASEPEAAKPAARPKGKASPARPKGGRGAGK